MKTHEKGFTLIELMVVVAIVGTMAALAIPAYQDYTIRAQISEGLTLSAASQSAVEEYYSEHGDWPDKNEDAGLSDKRDINGKYTKEVSVKKDGVIEIKFDNYAHFLIQNRKVYLMATDNNGSISWACLSEKKIKDNHLPPACRGDKKGKKGKK